MKKNEMKKNEEKIKRTDLIYCAWFYPDVFGPNPMCLLCLVLS